jgi:hypothetical protein
MSLVIAVLAQAVASPPETIDVAARQPCETQKSNEGEIVVCAHRSGELGPYRIKPISPRQSGIPKAEVRLADGVHASAESEQADVGGFPSNRFMVRLKIKF